MKSYYIGAFAGVLLAVFVSVALSVSAQRTFTRKGADEVRNQILTSVRLCNKEGMMITLAEVDGRLVADCGRLTVTIETPAPKVDCSLEKEVIDNLIREDYKRSVTGL